MSKIVLTYPSPTNRMRYSAHIVFEVCLGMEVEWVCNNKEDVLTISFRDNTITCPLHAISLGDDENARSAGVRWTGWLDKKYPCEVLGVTDLQFDPLAAAFFCCVRWEEVESQGNKNSKFRDSHGRYRGMASSAFSHDMLNTPLVENLAHSLAKQLGVPENLYVSHYTYEPTIDVDIAYAYKGRGAIYSSIAVLRDLMFFRWCALIDRIKVIRGGVDPYFTYDWLVNFHNRMNLSSRFFILYSEYKRPYDLPVNKDVLKTLIAHLVKSSSVSWHPSYAASSSLDNFVKEKFIFDKINVQGGNCTDVIRTHFLMGEQSSWKKFEANGIKHDFSMGYADHVGFRSGMSKPYPAYDLKSDLPLQLIIHPFAVMDSTLKSYLKLDASAAIDVVSQLSDNVREVGGVMVTVWHNTSVSDYGLWKGWQSLYKKVVSRCIP